MNKGKMRSLIPHYYVMNEIHQYMDWQDILLIKWLQFTLREKSKGPDDLDDIFDLIPECDSFGQYQDLYHNFFGTSQNNEIFRWISDERRQKSLITNYARPYVYRSNKHWKALEFHKEHNRFLKYFNR
jgi:hypothetical protein